MAEQRTRVKVEEVIEVPEGDTEIQALVEGTTEGPEATETETPTTEESIIDPEDAYKEAEEERLRLEAEAALNAEAAEEEVDPGMVLVVVPKDYIHRDNKSHATTTFKAGTYRMLKSIATDWWSVNNGVTLVEEE